MLWPLIDYLSNDDINYIRDTDHLAKVYVWSGRYVAAAVTEAVRLLRPEIVQMGPLFRIASLVAATGLALLLFERADLARDPWVAVPLATLAVTYPLALDLFSFNVNGHVQLVHFALCIAIALRLTAFPHKRIDWVVVVCLIAGLLNYQLIVMMQAIMILLFAARFHGTAGGWFRYLLSRGIEIVLALVGYALLKTGLDAVAEHVLGARLLSMKALSLADPGAMPGRLDDFARRLAQVFLGDMPQFAVGTKWAIYGAILLALILRARTFRETGARPAGRAGSSSPSRWRASCWRRRTRIRCSRPSASTTTGNGGTVASSSPSSLRRRSDRVRASWCHVRLRPSALSRWPPTRPCFRPRPHDCSARRRWWPIASCTTSRR